MAHLAIYTSNYGKYSPGDVIFAKTQMEIHSTHCEQISVIKSRIPGEKTPINSILKSWYDLIYEFRFERVSDTEVLRVKLSDNTTEVFGHPSIDVKQFIGRRKNAGLFGVEGTEVWYGGNIRYTTSANASMWQTLQTKYGIHPSTHPVLDRWPCGNLEVKHFLTCSVDNLENNLQQYKDLIDSEYSLDIKGAWNLVKLRKKRLPLLALSGLFNIPLNQIQDPTVEVSKRETIADIPLIFRDDRCVLDRLIIPQLIQSV